MANSLLWDCTKCGALQGHPSAFRRATGLALGMFASTVETWRPTRQALTPTFSGMKMKLVWVHTKCVQSMNSELPAVCM